MARRLKSLKSDNTSIKSSKGDVSRALFDILRDARLNRNLSQQELAASLGLRQRQISDLERAANDPRLSTIQNVARGLDLELILIPRRLIAAVEGLQRSSAGAGNRPMYTLDAAESDPDDSSPVEVGGTDESDDPARLRRRPKDPRS